MKTTLSIIAGSFLHLVVLAAPVMVVRSVQPVAGDPVVIVFLSLATVFYLAELTRRFYPDFAETCPTDAAGLRMFRLAAATGIVLLLLQWAALIVSGVTLDDALGIISLTVGGLLMLGGAALRFAAIRTLGRQFVTGSGTTDDRRLVTAGPYRTVRHPSETGLLLYAAGASLTTLSPVAAALWLIALLPLVHLRLKEEERALIKQFGEQYEAYVRTTGRLLPRIGVRKQ